MEYGAFKERIVGLAKLRRVLLSMALNEVAGATVCVNLGHGVVVSRAKIFEKWRISNLNPPSMYYIILRH